jgi:hypothetical protein
MHKFEMIKFFCIDNSSQQRELSTSITSTPPDNNILVVSDQINAGENHSLI